MFFRCRVGLPACFHSGPDTRTGFDSVLFRRLAGVGIARGPHFILGDDLESGRLVHLLSRYESVDPDLWVVYPSRRQLSAKVRAFIDFLEGKFHDWPAAADSRAGVSRR